MVRNMPAMTHHYSHSHQDPWRDFPDVLAENLVLEATLNEPLLHSVLEEAAAALDRAPATVLDLGSGTGAGTVALAQRFPGARVHALDVSPKLLGHVRAAVVDAGVGERVEPHEVDLDGGWAATVPRNVDLVWSALTLHHVADPAVVLRQIFDSLRPGGVFVLTELTGETAFEPADLGGGGAGLRDRLAELTAAHGHHGGGEWQNLLRDAGFVSVRRHDREFIARADSAEGARYLAIQLRGQRGRLAERLSDEELAGLDAAIAALGDGASPLSLTSGREVWVAVRPTAG